MTTEFLAAEPTTAAPLAIMPEVPSEESGLQTAIKDIVYGSVSIPDLILARLRRD